MNYKERDPVLVDSYDQAVEKNEIALGIKLEHLKNDLTDIWGKLDDIINNRWNLFGVKDEYFVNTEEWLEFQGKASELDPTDESVVYTIPEQMRRMEFEVSKYYPNSRLKQASHLEKEIQEVYSVSKLPWIIGYSGGKDSTVTTQLVWNSLIKLPKKKIQNPIYIISSDTLVETPVIVSHITSNIARMNKISKEKKFPFKANIVSPEIKNSFWVNLLGKGYPAPTNQFRWCTERLKIQPANNFINEKLSE